MRDLRKVIYRLEEQDNAVGNALYRTAILCYRCYDSLILKRSSRPDYGSEKLLLKNDRILYVGVPKVATRSMLTALQSATPETQKSNVILEVDIRTLLKDLPEVSEYFKFTFVRNPYSRVASCYREKIKHGHPRKQARHLHNRRNLEAGMSFTAFAEWLNSPEGSDSVADRHWMSQYRILALDEAGVIEYDFIGRFERLARDYDRLINLSGLKLPPLSHRLRTQAPDEYRNLYDDHSRELIARRYARDIELFGYTFEAGAATENGTINDNG
jgi:hypothetical protein